MNFEETIAIYMEKYKVYIISNMTLKQNSSPDCGFSVTETGIPFGKVVKPPTCEFRDRFAPTDSDPR